MLSRIASLVVAVVGIMAALVIGLWTLIVLGILGLTAGCIRLFRRPHGQTDGSKRIVEGEFEVVEENIGSKKRETP